MEKKTVLITGASRGIGYACAKKFSQNGYIVFINYNKSEAEAKRLVEDILNEGGNAYPIKADVSNASEVMDMFKNIEKDFGGVDVLINNAGVAKTTLLTDMTENEWDELFEVNVKGVFNCTKQALPYMINKKRGKIVNVSSVWGICGASCEVAYSASKAAVIGFTKALAKEVGPSGICVNCVAPGVIDTDMNASLSKEDIDCICDSTPLCRVGSTEEVANVVCFLSSSEADFITGQIISPNGGFVI